jgi:hypothetical protein
MVMTPEELRDATCIVCPAQVLAVGQFDVSARPGAEFRYDRAMGMRVDLRTDTPVCVHPYRVGLSPGAYLSERKPVPTAEAQPPTPTQDALALPADAADLEGWIIALLRAAPEHLYQRVLEAAEEVAGETFDAGDIVVAMRRVLTVELARPH